MVVCIACSHSYIQESMVILSKGVLLVTLKKDGEIILEKSFNNHISSWISSRMYTFPGVLTPLPIISLDPFLLISQLLA